MTATADLAKKYLAWVDAGNAAAETEDMTAYNAAFEEHWGLDEDRMELLGSMVVNEDDAGRLEEPLPEGMDNYDMSIPDLFGNYPQTRLLVLNGANELCVWAPREPDAVLSHPKGAMLVWRKVEA
jgi:hypothetical protein